MHRIYKTMVYIALLSREGDILYRMDYPVQFLHYDEGQYKLDTTGCRKRFAMLI